MPRVMNIGPPGRANAFTLASSTISYDQGRFGLPLSWDSRLPRPSMYWLSSGFSLYRPYVCSASCLACFPSSISCDSESRFSCIFPVAGLRTQEQRARAISGRDLRMRVKVGGQGAADSGLDFQV